MPGAGVCALVSASWILITAIYWTMVCRGAIELCCGCVELRCRRPGQCCHGHAANISTGAPSAEYSAVPLLP